ncbi:MAG: ATP-binding cassette domain-containing protein [Chloroflexi bacterium]|nr:ATP-binding cassette domain-containing protein [Chloroflexota bacterium]
MLRAVGLVKEFGVLRAVDGLNFEVGAGEIYGLLGPNGAGKTTAMRILGGLLQPTAGWATVAGYSVTHQPDAVRGSVGILTEVPGLYARLTPWEYLDFFAQLHDIRQRRGRIEEMLRLVGLWDRRHSVMRPFSKGMQQRVAIPRTLLQDPPVLLLDEPTAALDPEAARGVRDYVRDLAASRGRTVLLCTHNLFEAEQLCHRLSIVRGGRQLAEGTPTSLRARAVATCVLRVGETTSELLEGLHGLPQIDSIKVESAGRIVYQAPDTAAANPVVVRTAVAAGADVLSLSETAASLEDVYLEVIAAPALPSATLAAIAPEPLGDLKPAARRSRWSHARLIALRELREMLRDPNLMLPLIVMPCLIGLLAGISSFASFGPSTGAVGTAMTNAALDRLPDTAVQRLSNLPTTDREATLETLLKAFSIPLFWVIPVALTPAVAADSFVGERERFSLEPLLAAPVATTQVLLGKLFAGVIPAVGGTALGVLVLWIMTVLSRTQLYPRVLIADPDWLFSLLVVTPLVALFTAGVAALISTRVSGFRVAYQLNGLIALPIVLVLIPAAAFGFLLDANALGYVAGLFAVVDVIVILWANRLFDRERLLSKR